MNKQLLNIPTLYYNVGCTQEAFKDLQDDKIRKALIITDSIVWNLYGKKMELLLKSLKIKFNTFMIAPNNSSNYNIENGTHITRSFKPSMIIAFGGGTILDVSKVIRFKYENPGVPLESLIVPFAKIKLATSNKLCKLITIPTTAGTGSEVTPFAVFHNEKTDIRKPLISLSLLPTMAIIDADYQQTLPKKIIAISGFDALSHGFEALVSNYSTEFTDPFAIKSIVVLMNELSASYNGIKNSRVKIAHASTLAGISIANAFLGITHSLSHQISNFADIPHGMINAVLLPHVININSNNAIARKKYCEVAKIIGLKSSDEKSLVQKLISLVTTLRKKLNLPDTLKNFNINKSEFLKQVENKIENIISDECTKSNPIKITQKDIVKIFNAIM